MPKVEFIARFSNPFFFHQPSVTLRLRVLTTPFFCHRRRFQRPKKKSTKTKEKRKTNLEGIGPFFFFFPSTQNDVTYLIYERMYRKGIERFWRKYPLARWCFSQVFTCLRIQRISYTFRINKCKSLILFT